MTDIEIGLPDLEDHDRALARMLRNEYFPRHADGEDEAAIEMLVAIIDWSRNVGKKIGTWLGSLFHPT